MKKSLTIAIISILIYTTSTAQQLLENSQYLMNSFLINPSQAGYNDLSEFGITSRLQWVGLKNAPRLFSFSAQGRLLDRKFGIRYDHKNGKTKLLNPRSGNIGIGVNLVSDQTGYVNNNMLTMAYSYHITMSGSRLSLGLAGSVMQLSLRQKTLKLRDQDDPSIYQMGETFYAPDASIGLFYSRKNLYTGISVIQLFESNFKIGSDRLGNYNLNRHYFVMSGYKIYISKYYCLEPSLMFKTTEQLASQTDISLLLHFSDDFWTGLTYRTNNAFVIIAGIRIEMLYIGYAFDYAMDDLSLYKYGTHELSMVLKLDYSKRHINYRKKAEDKRKNN
jgi:type IX secretion system PorP/SprF family membrane protein